jgi:hypothetical protein
MPKQSNADVFVYIDELRWREWSLHLNIKFSGEDNKVSSGL